MWGSYRNSSYAPQMDPHEIYIHHWTHGDTRNRLLTQTIQYRCLFITNQQTEFFCKLLYPYDHTIIYFRQQIRQTVTHINTATTCQYHKYDSGNPGQAPATCTTLFMVFVSTLRKKWISVLLATAGICIYCHFACPPIISSIIHTYTVKLAYHVLEKNTITKQDISQVEKSAIVITV